MLKAIVIGAGPAGCYAAGLLAAKGVDVSVFEEHSEVGSPVQCTGIVTSRICDFVTLKKEFVANKISKAGVFAPSGRFAEIRLKDNIILDRAAFDKYLMKCAEKAGARFFLGHRFLSLNKRSAVILDRNSGRKKEVCADFIIGADGPFSDVAKACGLYGERKFSFGVQARVKLKNNNAVEFYPFFEDFAWVVPESKDVARIGVSTKASPRKALERFISMRLESPEIIDMQCGPIPVFNPKQKAEKGNVFLLGDAAGMVKATTGGGIVQGLAAARSLARSILNNKSYEKEWRKAIGNELRMHLYARKAMSRLKYSEWDRLIRLLGSKRLQKELRATERDFLLRLLPKAVIAEPRLVSFLRHILP